MGWDFAYAIYLERRGRSLRAWSIVANYHHLGDLNQKYRTKPWFDNQPELVARINAAHTAKMVAVDSLGLC